MVTLAEITLAIKAEVDANNIIGLIQFFTQFNNLNDKIQQKQQTDDQAIHDAGIATATIWWNTIKPSIPTTRQQALTAYNFIKNLIGTETDQYRIEILKQKLQQADDKFKEIKALG